MLELLKNNKFFRIFSCYGFFSQVFAQINEWPILKLHEMIIMLPVVACPIIFILYDDREWQEKVLQIVKNDHFLVFLIVFFLKFFGQFNEWLMLELHKTIRVSHIVACPIVVILFYKQRWQGEVLKVMKNDFLVFLAVGSFSPIFWAG